MKLSIGCRNRQVGKDWKAVDIVRPLWADKYPDRFILADAHCLPFADEQFDLVLASHIFEHFSRINEDRITVMKEWWRVIKPGGILRIIVPNTARYCHLYAEGKWDMKRLSDMMFGMQTHLGEIHYAGYDAKTIGLFFTKNLGEKCSLASLSFGRRGRFPIPDLEIRAILEKKI